MNEPAFQHRILDRITPAIQSALDAIAGGHHQVLDLSEWTPAQRAILLDIASLQTKAVRNFGRPPQSKNAWWVTRSGLQQSTLARVADFKASLLGKAPVVELCCGLGGDSIALAKRGPVTCIDIDEDILCMAQANCRIAGVDARFVQADVTQTSPNKLIDDAAYVVIDPDRRADGVRHTQAEDLVPDWTTVMRIMDQSRGGLVKLAPATRLPEVESSKCHRMWISSSGSVREQTTLHGEVLACDWLTYHGGRVGERSAVIVRDDSVRTFHSPVDQDDTEIRGGSGVGRWLLDPDPAIRASGLTAAFATATHAVPVGTLSGFLTLDNPATFNPFLGLGNFAEVLEVVGCDDRKLRRCFRARNAYPEVIKVRGVDQDPAKLSKRMRTCGDEPLGLWIGRNGKKTFAAITTL